MKRMAMIGALMAVAAFVCTPAVAQEENGTLYDQEGTANDGYGAIDATGQGPTTDPSITNWKYQYGSGTWSGVYRKDGWLEIASTGDSVIDIECDIEMYYSESFSNNKVYFHIGDPFGATSADKTAIVDGTYTANNGMYIGISFTGTSKSEVDMLKDGTGAYTGEIQNAMVGTTDVLGREMLVDPAVPGVYHSFNIKISLSWDAGATFYPPITYGDGASGTVHDTLWWLVDNGNIGTYALQYKIELLMGASQPDGNYHFDPALVAAPVL